MSPVSPVVQTEATVGIGLKKHTQSGNIHSIILDVHAVKQSMLKTLISILLTQARYKSHAHALTLVFDFYFLDNKEGSMLNTRAE